MPVQALALALSLTVFAASDVTPALRRLIPEFERATHSKVTLVPGSTGTLSQQIRNGAPADVFFAANEAAVDDLSKDGLVRAPTRTVYARGRLVLIALSSIGRQGATLKDLTSPAIRRIAIANPAHAPYGLAAQQALQAAGLWDAIRPKLVYGENVQQAVQFVESGSAEAGLVARSLAGRPNLIFTEVAPSLYAPLNQTAVVLARSKQPALAASFLDFVKGARGRAALKAFGFLVPGEDF
ncbi:MAG TPA: molybdate ABC transporter substrate-binding protein [Vicinamibacterales bacterium]|nr:molybdate ABC transporter substrate-binding protein [Vicinamibacterales bacterium]